VPNQTSGSNIARFMDKHEISDWHELVEKANSDIGGYWDAVNEGLGIEWFQKYEKNTRLLCRHIGDKMVHKGQMQHYCQRGQ
jgi:hypothetical protein